MPELIEHYESVARASRTMLAAARRGDWDALVAAEGECATFIETLKSVSAERALRSEHAPRKAAIIREVLAHDAEIRDLAQPWMKQLETLIGGTARERKVQDAYGV